jgi:hypothetical protein
MRMVLEHTWTASSADCIAAENRDLYELAGVWSSQVHVSISNPAKINYRFAKFRFAENEDLACPPSGTESD